MTEGKFIDVFRISVHAPTIAVVICVRKALVKGRLGLTLFHTMDYPNPSWPESLYSRAVVINKLHRTSLPSLAHCRSACELRIVFFPGLF
jgi:hypothetical protein